METEEKFNSIYGQQEDIDINFGFSGWNTAAAAGSTSSKADRKISKFA